MAGSKSYWDVTGTVDCTRVDAVLAEALAMLDEQHPELDQAPLQQAFADLRSGSFVQHQNMIE